ncbi:MAG: 23S rRNA (adenine(2503)-C(2))-methyltransferase RlmN [Oscillospiraceae bacterium]|jgi:23S rRNA (adenine2503-C2)-methyltransferase|nr:23S rRNA (adenine(2503)-C(2))-methyltransferase RlmN [Oscillospiraceae bacterium]
MDKLPDLRAMPFEDLRKLTILLGFPPFRAKQIFAWVQRKGVPGTDDMTDLSVSDRALLARHAMISGCEIAAKQVSKIDGTVKYLFRLDDGETIESVVMRYGYGLSICASAQVGCRMGCKFCASGMGGLVRNLTAGEMLGQIFAAQHDLRKKINHMVLMGMGEPLDNYTNVLAFLRLVGDPNGQNMSMRKVSLSTCGLVSMMHKLSREALPVTLSVSLHAPNNALRSELMPVNQAYPIETLLDACRAYIKTTGRRISFEYAMFDGRNDTPDCAYALARLLKGMLCHVNLIPANPVEEHRRRRSHKDAVRRFQDILEQAGIPATVRRTLGADISAACGQLRRQTDTAQSFGVQRS